VESRPSRASRIYPRIAPPSTLIEPLEHPWRFTVADSSKQPDAGEIGDAIEGVDGLLRLHDNGEVDLPPYLVRLLLQLQDSLTGVAVEPRTDGLDVELPFPTGLAIPGHEEEPGSGAGVRI
jgi:hypothetical protein